MSSWASMSSVAMPVNDYTFAITDGTHTASFTFRVRRQPASTRAFARLGRTADRFTLSFIVDDVTDYSATGNPRSAFGTLFTEMLIKALRTLVWDVNSVIPSPGEYVSFGAGASSIVDNVEIAQINEKTVDSFFVTCNVEEVSTSSWSITSEEVPKVAKSDEPPPWQMPADVDFDCQTTEGMTLGYAYATKGLDSEKTYKIDDLRKMGLAKKSEMVPVVNSAGDPFQSPPAMPKVSGTLRISKSFLRGGGTVKLSGLQGVVNKQTIRVSIVGADFFFPEGTLSPTMLKISPKMFKKPVPWYPKTKHPLSKTYGELFYGYSKAAANRIAVNRTGTTIIVYEPLRYIEVSAAFMFRPEGFGVWIANRGYLEVDSESAEGTSPITDANGMMKESWLDSAGKKTSKKKLWCGFTNMLGSAEVENLLNQFFPMKADDFSWATEKDNFGNNLQ